LLGELGCCPAPAAVVGVRAPLSDDDTERRAAAVWSIPPDKRRSLWVKLEPRPAAVEG